MKKLLSLSVALIAATSFTSSVQATALLKAEKTNVVAISQQAQTLVQLDMQTLSIDNSATTALLSLTKKLDEKAKTANPQRYKKSNYAANLAD